MPSKSEAQHKLMEAVAHDPKFAEKVKIPQKVGKEFVAADKMRDHKHCKDNCKMSDKDCKGM